MKSMKNTVSTQRIQQGFTLIEVMIVVVMIAILASIALPSYESYMRKTRRIDAKNSLLDLAMRQEKFYSINNKYSATASDLGYSALPYAVPSSNNNSYYDLSITLSTDTQSYTATATPKGPQLNDAECYAYTLANTGQRGNVKGSTTLAPEKCW